MIQTMKSVKRVSFEDCDPFSHLNNANYLTYFLNAREEQLRTNGVLNIFEHAVETGKSWAVVCHRIKYLKPSRLGEELEIWTRMLTYDAFRNLVEFVMLCPKKKQLKSVMLTEFAYFSIKKSKPVKMDKEMRKLLKKISLFPETDLASFRLADRIQQIKSEIR